MNFYKTCKGITKAGNPCKNLVNSRSTFCCKAHAEGAGEEWRKKKKPRHVTLRCPTPGCPNTRSSKKESICRKCQRILAIHYGIGSDKSYTNNDVIHFTKSGSRISSEGYTRKQWYCGVYLKSLHWEAVKNRYFSEHEYRCCVCGDANKTIHLHHLTYDNLWGERWEDVQPMCDECHSHRHKEQNK